MQPPIKPAGRRLGRLALLLALTGFPLGAARAARVAGPRPSKPSFTKSPSPSRAPAGKPASSAPAIPPVQLTPTTPPTAAIDQLIARKWRESRVAPAPLCDDRTFARRLYLDLAGRIPTQAEVDEFVREASDKRSALSVKSPAGTQNRTPNAGRSTLHAPRSTARERLVDRLLASPEYARHMREVFDVVFMGRSAGSPGPRRRRGGGGQAQGLREEWLGYLERGFAENRPWDRLARDVVLARPESPGDRGAVWYLYARDGKYQEMAESVSSTLFGVQVQCAQCHDHFVVPEIKQKDYWGLVAFFNRSKNQETKAGPRVAESAIGGFSNFATLAGQSFPAELTFFGKSVPETRPAATVMEQDSPTLYRPSSQDTSSDEPKVPLFSRREQFAETVVKANPLVARAAVNRFWELLMGRGIVHPVDKMDSQHPPSHPELLDWLAADFERSGYDVKRLVRAIVLSRPYQLQARQAAVARPDLFAAGIEKPLTAEQLYRSLMVATTGKADAENGELQKALAEVFPDVFPEENVSTLRQAMFLTNNPLVQKLTAPESGTTAERLARIADPAARVREAFRTAYAREPDAEELKAAVAYLKARTDRAPQATAQLWWALLSGAEFRFNH